ncbi:hypothetical protein TW95_gp0375 [Pandoravirus inopinatum]|uniref:Ankyrin repeat protein n=1 Tax=Pandoravirus inopinatum TaxID=1605721 RepID=A0A0B5J0W1_9VIRU|nr:hypothetical protein TW95_gp0375 [Pandoravirus inopinatum]AJF97109.1 hypothetical protein [Pandoravirus inopinatum]
MTMTATPMELEDTPCERATSLVDMPVEILLAIARHLAATSVRDMVVWSQVVGLDLPTQLLGTAMEDALLRLVARTPPTAKAVDLAHRKAVASGAPLCVVQHIARYDRSNDLLHAAVIGGRVDVLQWAWSHACPDRSVWYDGSWSDFRRALKDAMCHDRREVLIWLLERRSQDWYNMCEHYDDVMTFALDKGYADVADTVHRAAHEETKMRPFWKRCFCGHAILDDAVRRGRVGVLVMLEQIGCHLTSTISDRHLAKTVRRGHMDAARWIAARLDTPTISERDMGKAAVRGHVSIVAFVHDTGMGTCTPTVVERAVIGGHTNVLDWAIGRGQAPPARPIVPWYGPHLAYTAAEFGRQDVLAWMARQPDIAPTPTVGVARRAVARGHWSCAVALHDCGVIPLDTWDALGTVLRHATGTNVLDIHSIIKTLAEKGARCTPDVMLAALCHKTCFVLPYLCERFGTSDLQAAVDAASGLDFGHESLAWVAANVRSVCVAQLAHQQRGMLNVTAHTCCQCARCTP